VTPLILAANSDDLPSCRILQ